MATVPKNLCRNVQESMLDGHKDDVSYNLWVFLVCRNFALNFLFHILEVWRSNAAAVPLPYVM